jgi:uncharacterized protein (UPF0276 family)
MSKPITFPGYGLGLRSPHYQDFLEQDVPVDFVEVISENFMIKGGKPLRILEQVRLKHEVSLHGVSMSVGSAHGLDQGYLARLKTLVARIEPLWVSDHLCWTRTTAHNSHDLLPLPLTMEALKTVCANIHNAQDYLGRAMLFENPSSYLSFAEDEMTEASFLKEMVSRTGCYLLLDVNNLCVNAHNHRFDPLEYLAQLPLSRVREIHLAGHTPGDIRIDTHDRPVCGEVWALYEKVISRTDRVATLLERDDAIPPLPELLAELDCARNCARKAKQEAAA